MENKKQANKPGQNQEPRAYSSIEEVFEAIFGGAAENKKEQLEQSANEVAEALWIMYVAFRRAGFDESQAMCFCIETLKAQGGN